jgi:hypothetical protein
MTGPLKHIQVSPLGRRLTYRFGPAVWRLPRVLRRRLCFESAVPRLPHARRWDYGHPERVRPPRPLSNGPLPTFGHRLAARPYKVRQPFVAEVPRAWLVGRHAAAVTDRGRLLLTAFRDAPRMLGLERHEDLEAWLAGKKWAQDARPLAAHVCSLVSRLDANYYHWITESCGQLEGLRAYEQRTGVRPRILIRADGHSYLRQSVELLSVPPEDILEWAPQAPPLLVEHLVVPSLPGILVASSPRSLNWLRQQFLRACGLDCPPPRSALRRIYIPRRQGGWRSVLNEDRVIRALEAHGFETFAAESLPLAEQIRRFHEAEIIVGLHGSGLTNVLFAPSARVLELLGTYGDGAFYSIAASFGQPYDALRCRPAGDDVTVDTDALLRAVDRLCRLQQTQPAPGGEHAPSEVPAHARRRSLA